MSTMQTTTTTPSSEHEHVSIKFTVEPQVLTQQQRPCVIYHEIRFAEAIKIEFITFRNFYCAFVSIHKLTESDEWIAVLSKHQLMKNGHYENDAQNSHIIRSDQFIKTAANTKTSALRFYLIQPSSNWISFGLRDLMCYTLKNKQKKKKKEQGKENDEKSNSQPLNIQNAALLFRKLANENEKR